MSGSSTPRTPGTPRLQADVLRFRDSIARAAKRNLLLERPHIAEDVNDEEISRFRESLREDSGRANGQENPLFAALRYLSSGRPHYVWLFLSVLGVLSAIVGFAMDVAIDRLRGAHMEFLDLIHDGFGRFIVWVLFGVLMLAFSVWTTHTISPFAVGSGIPEMKSILGGSYLGEYLSFRTLISKVIGLTTALGSGLSLGKEGPFVHTSSVLAKQLLKLKIFRRIDLNDGLRMQMLAAGCAVGVSSNFGAPVGGVLFSIEVTALYYSVENYWKAFLCAVSGALTFRLISALLRENSRHITALFNTNYSFVPYDTTELIAFSFVGAIIGLCSSAFVMFNTWFAGLRRRYPHAWVFRSLYIMPTLTIVATLVLVYPSSIGPFMALGNQGAVNDLFGEKPLYEDDDWENLNVYGALILFILTKFVLTAVSITLPIPSGVYTPVFVVGAAIGRLCGEVMADIFPEGISGTRILPGGYAVVGAAAMAGGVTHTISSAVILFELTGQLRHILPVLVAVLISIGVASRFTPSIYDAVLMMRGHELPYLREFKHKKSYLQTAARIMRTDVKFLTGSTTYRDVAEILRESDQGEFPIVDSERSRVLLGAIQRGVLEALVEQRGIAVARREVFVNDMEGVEMTGRMHRERADSSTSDDGKLLLAQGTAPGEDEPAAHGNAALHTEEGHDPIDDVIDFEDSSNVIIDAAPLSLPDTTPLGRLHKYFGVLMLDRVYVTCAGELVGLVTRREIMRPDL